MERGFQLNNISFGGKPCKNLDLRSPQTKFNLMRKLKEVKEQNNSSEEDEDETPLRINDFELGQ